MLKTRIISSIFGVIALAALIWAGGGWLQAFFVLLGLAGMFEFFQMMKNRKMKAMTLPACLLYLCLVCSSIPGSYWGLGIFLAVLAFMASLFIGFHGDKLPEMAFSLMGALYMGFGIHYAFEISSWPDYLPAIVLVFILTWSSDIGGYAIGTVWGSRKMAPSLSPGKTWEGSAGCVGLTVLASLAFAALTGAPYPWLWAALGIAASIAAQMGDLLESAFKRYFGVKDSGNIIPGHGGVLDRFDSFLFVLPLVYYVLIFMEKLQGS